MLVGLGQWPTLKRKLILCYVGFKHSDWLKKSDQPIRVFLINVTQIFAENYLYRLGSSGQSYQSCTFVIYNSRVVLYIGNFLVNTALEWQFTIAGPLLDWQQVFS